MELFKFMALVIASALWSAVLVVFFHKKDVHLIRGLLDRFSRLGWMCKVGVLFLVVQLTMFGGAKHGGTNDVTNVDGTNVVTEASGTSDVGGVASGDVESGEAESFPLQGMGLRGPFLSGRPSQSLTSGKDSASPLSVTDILPGLSITDIARGYRLESVATNDDISWLKARALGACIEIDIDVYEPEVVCRNVGWMDIGVVDQAGLLDLRLALYVVLSFVSFKDLYMEEIPDDEVCPHGGYFNEGDSSRTGAMSQFQGRKRRVASKNRSMV